jgi:hypothetical protein
LPKPVGRGRREVALLMMFREVAVPEFGVDCAVEPYTSTAKSYYFITNDTLMLLVTP